MRSSLSACQIPTPASDEDILNKQKRLWHEKGGVMLTREQIETLPVVEQFQLEALATRLYGRKHG